MSIRSYLFPRAPRKYKLPVLPCGHVYRRTVPMTPETAHQVEMLMVAACAKTHHEALALLATGKPLAQIIRERRKVRIWKRANLSSAWRRFKRALFGG